MILEEDLNVRVLAFPEGEDPDSYAKAHSTSEINEFLEKESFDFIRFKTKLLLKETGDDPIKRAGLIKEIVESIALIPDPIARSVYIQECSSLLNIGEQALLSELNKVRRNKLSKTAKKVERQEQQSEVLNESQFEIKEKTPTIDVIDVQERDILRTLVKYGNTEIEIPTEETKGKKKEEIETLSVSVAEYLIFEIEQDGLTFKKPVYDKIYHLFKSAFEAEKQVPENDLISNEDQEISSFVIECLLEKYSLSLNWEEKHKILTITEDQVLPTKVHKGICSWRLGKVQEMISEKQELLKNKNENYESILQDLMRLNDAKKALAHELSRIILR